MGRIAAGLYAAPGPLRIYAGGTTAMNDATSIRTDTCTRGCTTTETGKLSLAGIAMIGAGIRWQAHPMASVGLELWVPLTEVGTRLPVMVSLSVRLGDLAIKKREAKLSPPPPPPDFTPDSPEPLPQL